MGDGKKDAFFPERAMAYFDQLREQYELLLDDTNRTAPKAIATLLARVAQAPHQITWSRIFALQSAFFYALPEDRLLDELRILRDRYRSVVGVESYRSYVSEVEADVHKLTPAQLRSELLALAERLRYVFTFVPHRERVRTKLVKDAAWLTIGVNVVGQVVSVVLLKLNMNVPTILIVIFAGVLGGFLSVQQRLQRTDASDPLLKEMQLRAGWFSVVILAPVSGAVFASVLYWLFLAKFLQGGLFPKFVGALRPVIGNDLSWKNFIAQCSPNSVADYGKLLVWSFIAGFAERFVPNVLTRLAGQAANVHVASAVSEAPTN